MRKFIITAELRDIEGKRYFKKGRNNKSISNQKNKVI